MERQGKIIVAFAVAVAALMICFMLAFNAHQEETEYGVSFSADAALRYPYQQLSAREQELYAALYNGIENHEAAIDLPHRYRDDEYEKVYLMLRMQEPQFFYVSNVYQLSSYMTEVDIQYDLSAEKAEKMSQELEKAATDIISEAWMETDECGKLLAIHDSIAKRCRYVKTANSENAYGCLVEGKAFCEGYAKAFCYVARKAGLNVMCVTGQSSRGNSHAWNIAKINGEFYQIDVTWDDSDEFRGAISHRYFAMPDSRFTDHRASQNQYDPPKCSATGADYYQRKGRVLHEQSQLATMLGEWARTAEYGQNMIEFDCMNEAGYENALAQIREGSVMQWVQPYARTQGYSVVPDEMRQIISILY